MLVNSAKKLINNILQLRKYKELIFQLTKRDFLQRYKGSYLSFLWAMLSPLVMLAVYSFIFIIIFKLKWESPQDYGKSTYTLMIFSGLVPFYIFSESINRSLTLIASNANYIKKVVFPAEILPISLVISTVINHGFGLMLLIMGKFLFLNTPNWTILLLPLAILPLVMLSLGLTLICAAVGVYVRDLVHVIGLLMNVLFYMSPIFYSTSIVPEPFNVFISINPLTPIIEQWRAIFIRGELFDLAGYAISLTTSTAILCLGFITFYLLRKGFADVI